MNFIKKIIYKILNGKNKITKPVFLKEFEKDNAALKELTELSNKITSNKKTLIKNDISNLKQDIEGIENVYNELKNSSIPMLCLNDIRLEKDNSEAHFDYIVITNKFIMALETIKVSGGIEKIERDVNVLKEALRNKGILRDMPIKPALVIANENLVVNKKKVPKGIRNYILNYNQVVNLIKQEISNAKNGKTLLEKQMYEIANFLLQNNKPAIINYNSKYSLSEKDFVQANEKAEEKAKHNENEIKNKENVQDEKAEVNNKKAEEDKKPVSDNKKSEVSDKKVETESKKTIDDNKPVKDNKKIEKENKNSIKDNKKPINLSKKSIKSDKDIYELLNNYRNEKAKEESTKPVFILSDAELNDLIEKKPKTAEDLLKVKGFGPIKVKKHGEAILEIFNGTL